MKEIKAITGTTGTGIKAIPGSVGTGIKAIPGSVGKTPRYTVEYEGPVEAGCSGEYIIIDRGLDGTEWIEYSGAMSWERAIERADALNGK